MYSNLQRCRRTGQGLYLVVLDENHDAFNQIVPAMGFVFCFEVVAEDAGYRLPEGGGKTAFEFIEQGVGSIAGFPVYEFQ